MPASSRGRSQQRITAVRSAGPGPKPASPQQVKPAGDSTDRGVLGLQRVVGNAVVANLLTPVQRAPKKAATGVSKYGTTKLTARLQDMMQRGVLGVAGAPATLDRDQLFLLQGVANVETGGADNAVYTKDNMYISLGFKQVTLGWGSLYEIINAAPSAFAKHGITLGSGTYTLKCGRRPAIDGAPDPKMLKLPPWTDKFFDAGGEDEVVSAMVAYTLKELGKMERRFVKDSPGKSNPWMKDPTARAWLLETMNNRPAYAWEAAKGTLARTNGQQLSREAFLGILESEIVGAYAARGEPKKARNIITKIPRTAPGGTAGAAKPIPGPAKTAPPTTPTAPAAPATGTDLAQQAGAVLPKPVSGAGGAVLAAIAAAGLTSGAIRLLAAAGHSDTTALTNLAFWSAHPDLFGTKLQPSQPGFRTLAAEWLQLRDGVVAQALKVPRPDVGPSTGPVAGPRPTGATTSPTTAPAQPAAPAGGLADQVAAANSASVTAAANRLRELETEFRDVTRGKWGETGNEGEELGEGRDKLVAGIAELRGMVATMTAGIAEPQMTALKASFYRAINAVSPFYYQHNNVIFEYSKKRGEKRDVWNTCNITSTAMALEALGKNPTDYDQPDLLPQVEEFFVSELTNKAADKTGSGLAAYRMPEVLAMAAVVEKLGNKKGTPTQVAAAVDLAFEWIAALKPLKILSEHFGVTATEHFHAQITELRAYGETHAKLADRQGDARKAGKATSSAGLTEGSIEQQVGLESYKRGVLKKIVPQLDAGKQIVVGQYHHFVRLQAIDENYIVKDDPGSVGRANLKINWEEARAMGLFNVWLVIG